MEFDPRFQRPKHFSYISRSFFPSNHHIPPTMFASQTSFLIPNSPPSSPFMSNVPTLSPTFAMRSPSSNSIYGISSPLNGGTPSLADYANVNPLNPLHPVMFAPNTNNNIGVNALHGADNNYHTVWSFEQRRTVVQPCETSPCNSPSSSSSIHSISTDSGMMTGEYSSWNSEKVVHRQTIYEEDEITYMPEDYIVKGQWTPQEDRILVHLVNQLGTRKWVQIAEIMQNRLGKQCRERWNNHLKPGIKKGAWTIEEDITLIEAHQELGNKWSKIAQRLPGRSENTIKNHWNGTKRRRNSVSHNKNKTYLNEGTMLHAYIKSVTEAEEDAAEEEKELNKSMETNDDENVLNCGCDELALLVGYPNCPHHCALMNGHTPFDSARLVYKQALEMAEIMNKERFHN